MKADNVTSLGKEREASEASKLAQGHFLGPPFRSVTPLSSGERVERVGCVGQFPPSCQAKYAVNGFAVAVRGLRLLRWKGFPGLPDFLGNCSSRCWPYISSTSLMHFQISGANVFIEYLFDVPYYEFPFLVFWNTSLTWNTMACLPHPRFPSSCYYCSGNPDRTRGGASSKEWPPLAGNKGLCTVGTAVFRPENRGGSIDQIGLNGEWNRHSEEQRS